MEQIVIPGGRAEGVGGVAVLPAKLVESPISIKFSLGKTEKMTSLIIILISVQGLCRGINAAAQFFAYTVCLSLIIYHNAISFPL